MAQRRRRHTQPGSRRASLPPAPPQITGQVLCGKDVSRRTNVGEEVYGLQEEFLVEYRCVHMVHFVAKTFVNTFLELYEALGCFTVVRM